MDIYQLKNMPDAEREAMLEGETWVEETYHQPLEPDEMTEYRRVLSQTIIEKSVILDEKKEAMDEFKAQLKPLETQIKATVESIKTRSKQVHGRIYSVSDFDNKMIHSVDPKGNVLGSRPMKPEERQHRLPLSKAVGE